MKLVVYNYLLSINRFNCKTWWIIKNINSQPIFRSNNMILLKKVLPDARLVRLKLVERKFIALLSINSNSIHNDDLYHLFITD